MNQPLAYVGNIEIVSLPEHGLDNVFAKIDTGADSSAIWASNISEKDGELCYTLFGPSSHLYSGNEIKTRKYSLVTVKNSFGQKEVRYKVNLRLKMADRVILTRITLANRINNRFPILIGRRTLKGKFLVDVSRKNSLLGSQKALLLVSSKSSANDSFIGFLRSEGIDINLVTYEELVFYIGGEVNKILIKSSDEDIAEYGLSYFRTSKVYGHSYVAATIAQYLENRNVDYIDRVVSQCSDPAKLYQYITMTDNNISVPRTIFMLPSRMILAYEKIVADLGTPFMLKDTKGFQGQNSYLIDTKSDFDRIMRQASDLDVWLLAQEYIANDHDYRLIVLGGQVTIAIKRTRDSTRLDNITQGSKVELADIATFPSFLINNAIAAAKLLKLQMAGVDIIQDKKTKIWYCLEVNQSPQVYSGAFIDQKKTAIAKYLSQRLAN
jgi:glutathione synthase/RimK-type ligase-like ATP-grasp enzyme